MDLKRRRASGSLIRGLARAKIRKEGDLRQRVVRIPVTKMINWERIRKQDEG